MEQTLNFDSLDTICAISTPPGTGGIAVIRVSGPQALSAVSKIWKGKDLQTVSSHTLHLGSITEPEDNSTLDQAVASVFRAPNSFTGDDTVEFSVHGSPYVQRRLLRILTDHCGARLAEPGEFTMRAFASGRFSLTQAEAVADIISSNSKAAHRIASSQFSGKTHARLTRLRDELTSLSALLELELDFSEEDVVFADRGKLIEMAGQIRAEISKLLGSFQSGKAIKEGLPVALAGATNAGKSSLLNRLIDDDRAIVSDIHGTTRDTVEAVAEFGDYLFRLMDTAGLRHTDDVIENMGIARSYDAIRKARITILVVDLNSVDGEEEIASQEDSIKSLMHESGILVTLLNKSDLVAADKRNLNSKGRIFTSAATGRGIEELKEKLVDVASSIDCGEDIMITNERHRLELERALESVDNVISGLKGDLSGDLVAIDLRATIHHLSMLTGEITTPQILNQIFSKFCIGK